MSILAKTSTKIAGMLLLGSLLLYVFCFIVSGGSGNENGPGAVWWYFLFFGLPSALAGVAILISSIFAELTKSKMLKISGRNYPLGSAVMLALLLALLVYIIYIVLR